MAGKLLRFNGQVAIVTGAGGGLGKEYATLLAERGASVVVNDLGGTRSGEGQSNSAADRVVQEIKAKGGKAVADYNSVENGEKIVKTAIDNFGRIDILINNAGILRDKSFLKLSNEDWESVIKVHLNGSFLVSKAAWPYFRKQNYGRIIMTASGAGIFGNFGQSNYAAAKLGLVGLSNTLAVEGAKYNIHSNVIVPLAGSRLTQDIFPQDFFEQLKPECISPVVVWLCHNSCSDNGGIYEAAGGWVGKYRWQRSLGKAFILPEEKLSLESVRDNWHEITNMTEASNPNNIQEHTALLVEALTGNGRDQSQKSKENSIFSYNHDHAILYALGVGASTTEPDHLKFLYEGSTEFAVLPTFGTIIAMPTLLDSAAFQEALRTVAADPTKMLHGEQYLELLEPLPVATTLMSTCHVADVLDKGSGAVVIANVDTYTEQGVKVMTSQWCLFFVGSGNFGGQRTSVNARDIAKIPSRKPDFVVQEKTLPNQAALYRLCGDKNPLHIDPSFSAMGGFKQPILHGLCTYGYASRHVLKHYANNDVKKFKSMKARFSGPIEPGHTIQTEMWKEGNRIIFECTAVETGKKLITGGYVDLESIEQNTLKSEQTPIPIPVQEPAPPVQSNSGLQSDFVFSEMQRRLPEVPDLASKTQAIFEWNITKNGKNAAQWILDLKNGDGSVYRGPQKEGKPHCTLTLEDETMIAMVTGKLDPRKAFMSGKLKVKGNIMLTQKLAPILKSKLPKGGITVPTQAPPPPTVTPIQGQPPKLKSEYVFQGYAESVARNPQFIEVQNVYQWNILQNGKLVAQWTFDLKNGKGEVYRGTPKIGKADSIITLEDQAMVDMAEGKLDSQKAFMTGKLKIQGDVLASEKLYDLREDYIAKEKAAAKKLAQQASKSVDSGTPPPPPTPPADEVPICIKSDIVFKVFAERLEEEKEIASKMKVIYHWNVLRDGRKMAEWTVDLKTGTGSIYKGAPKQKADVIMTLEDEDTIRLMTGKLNPQRAFMTGRLKIKGNIMLTQKLNQLWQEILKSGRAVELPLLEPILIDKPLDPKLFSEFAFLDLTKKLARLPELVTKIQAVFEITITKDGKKATQWTLDLKNGPGGIYRGPSKKDKASAILTIEDRDFSELVLGRFAAEHAFAKGGRVQISGSKELGEKVAELFKAKSKL